MTSLAALLFLDSATRIFCKNVIASETEWLKSLLTLSAEAILARWQI